MLTVLALAFCLLSFEKCPFRKCSFYSGNSSLFLAFRTCISKYHLYPYLEAVSHFFGDFTLIVNMNKVEFRAELSINLVVLSAHLP